MKTAREWLNDRGLASVGEGDLEARDREVAVKVLRDAATVAYAKNLLAAHSFLLDRAERAERGE